MNDLPLCSPRKTSLNFRKGFPNSGPFVVIAGLLLLLRQRDCFNMWRLNKILLYTGLNPATGNVDMPHSYRQIRTRPPTSTQPISAVLFEKFITRVLGR